MNTELAIIGVVSVVLNSFLFFVCVTRSRLRKRPQYFLLALVTIDVMAVVGWLSLTVASLFNDSWVLPSKLCKVQKYTMSMCLYLNSHSFVLMAFEQFFIFLCPSKHAEILINSAILIMLQVLWLFENTLLATFPYFGWGTITYLSNQFQCAMDHEKHVREANFVTVMCFGIPISLCLGLYMFMSIMVRKSMSFDHEADNGALIVKADMRTFGDSYSQRRQQLKFKTLGTCVIEPNNGQNPTYLEDGYVSSDSSDDENKKMTVQNDTQIQMVQQKKLYYTAKKELFATQFYIIMTYTVFLLWLPYVIDTYIFLKIRKGNVSDVIVFVVVFLCQCTTFIIPVSYVIYNSHFRRYFKKCFQRKSTKKEMEVAIGELSYKY